MEENINQLGEEVSKAKSILIIQAENPDGDSLGSALALEQILGEIGKEIYLYCPVDIPRYLRYIDGWDRVTNDFPDKFDMAIIVDAGDESVLGKAVAGANGAKLSKKPVVIIDHHDEVKGVNFSVIDITDKTAVSASQVVYECATQLKWPLDKVSGTAITAAIMSDSLGLISRKTSPRTVEIVSKLMEHQEVSLADLEDTRRKLGKKSREILAYKGKLISRLEYQLDNRLAVITIPYEEITKYSDQYNPPMLVMEDLRSTEDVQLAIAFKIYPDRITGKLRAYDQKGEICGKLAADFGGGGHPFAAGFKVYRTDYDNLKKEVLKKAQELLTEINAD